MAWTRRNAPLVLLGAALLTSGAMLLVLTRDLTFFQDTWEFLINRRDLTLDNLLRPHNEHIVLIPVSIELFFLHVFGMSSALPEYLLLIAMSLVSALLLFVYARRRVGPWPALMATALLLFVGPAWQDLLWPFELAFVGSVLFGIAMLLALDRDDGRGDAFACVFLTISAGFSSLGIAFMAAAAVDLFQRRRERGLRRAWFVAIPVVLFALWYLGWGHDAESHLTLRNVLDSPRFVLEGMAVSLESLLGLSKAPIEGAPETVLGWGEPLLVAAIALVVVQQIRRPGFSAGFWPVLAATAASWFLTAFNYIPGREPSTGRYMYAAGAFTLLLAVELLRGVRFSRKTLTILGAVTIAAVASNIHFFRDGSDWLKNQSVLTKADLAGIEIARDRVAPEFELAPSIAGTSSLIDVFAGPYLKAEAEFGSPAYTPKELVGAPEPGRRQADVVISQALPLRTSTSAGAERRGKSCKLGGGPGGPEDTALTPGVTKILAEPGPQLTISLARFAEPGEYPVKTAGAPGDSTTLLTIPRDRSEVPWRVRVEARQAVYVCGRMP
ncbi:MAG TPA: hypothetical protein VFS64_09740 [Solirubrobacterales bacterium]|nr:hypothetical protein [Solirubrobacterales bacterium]